MGRVGGGPADLFGGGQTFGELDEIGLGFSGLDLEVSRQGWRPIPRGFGAGGLKGREGLRNIGCVRQGRGDAGLQGIVQALAGDGPGSQIFGAGPDQAKGAGGELAEGGGGCR